MPDGLSFSKNPFGLIPDTHHVYLSDSYLEAFTTLHEGLLEGKRILLLVAESGMGKTLLLRELKHRLDTTARIAFLSVLAYEPHEQMCRLLGALGVDAIDQDLPALGRRLIESLESESDDHKRSVLIIDEAQALSDASLETLRQLSNSETPTTKQTQIIVAGQPQLLEKIRHHDIERPLGRIGGIAALRPLSRTEVHEYIDCRLGLLGIASEEIFTRHALALISKRSEGNPARVDAISLNALNEARRLGVGKVDINCALKAIKMVDPRRRERAIREYARWPLSSISAVILVTLIAIFSYRLLIWMPGASVQHDRSPSSNVSSSLLQLPPMSDTSKQPEVESVHQDLAEPPANRMATKAAVQVGQKEIATRRADSQPPWRDPRREIVSREIHRGSVFMAQGRYRDAIRAFKIAGILGAASRTISRKIAEARSAEAAEKQVLQ